MRKAIVVALSFVGLIAAGLFLPPKSWFYQNRRPPRLGKAVNRLWVWTASLGLTPSSWPGKPRIGTVGLEVIGRRSGQPRSSVVTWVELDSERYFVSMLGERTDWVRNVRAAQGHAVIRHRSREEALLEEVPIYERAPLLRAYLKRTAVATRHHLGVDPAAPLAEFERIAPAHPVFHIVSLISQREE